MNGQEWVRPQCGSWQVEGELAGKMKACRAGVRSVLPGGTGQKHRRRGGEGGQSQTVVRAEERAEGESEGMSEEGGWMGSWHTGTHWHTHRRAVYTLLLPRERD